MKHDVGNVMYGALWPQRGLESLESIECNMDRFAYLEFRHFKKTDFHLINCH